MPDKPDKPTARSYSVASTPQQSAGPLAWGDKCFLCGKEIGESDPRGFYTGKKNNAMMLAHRGCLNTLDAVGGDPKNFPRTAEKPESVKAKDPETVEGDLIQMQRPVPPPDVVQTNSQLSTDHPKANPFAGTHIRFESFEHMQSFIQARGPIPDGVKISVGELVIRD